MTLSPGEIAARDLSTTMGVLRYGVLSNRAGLMLQIAVNAAGFARPAWVRVRDDAPAAAGRSAA